MKKRYFFNIRSFLLLWVLILTLITEPIFASLLIIDTKGYSSGRLSRVALERTFNNAYIGEVLLGYDSITFVSFGNQPPNLVSNPWQFCFEKDRYEEIEKFIGNNVVLEFKTPKKNALLSCSATNELVTIYPVDKNQTLEQTHFIGRIHTNDPEISSGIEFGRIVNVIENKDLLRSYFMTIQMGGGGSSFRHFVMDDPDLFDFAVKCLKIGAMVRIYFSERFSVRNLFGLSSMSFVSEIEIVD
ncbi:hypothetical protein [Nitrosomonas sp. Nm33]|uniref:hypothetical protein n=1 Tax=Nitrosomonas sp. Nm33 TaxID=133724 RepID=UPI000898969F|nr:hypothetical protein [Nitrosomonas sp. Nm33]SDY81524.1 hypothetical protein SAMN05421755_105117 [Nitrosomonas sp. Nm33]